MNKFKRILLILYKFFYSFLYRLACLKAVNKNKVVIVLSRGSKLEGNLLYIYNEIRDLYPEIKVHFVNAENKMNLSMFIEILKLYDAKFIILDDYYLPVYLIKPRKGQQIIQLWHAAGALKKIGYSTMGKKFGPSQAYIDIIPLHSNYSKLYVSSSSIIKFYAEAFNMDEKDIYPFGMPRADLFFNRERKDCVTKDLKKKYPFINHKINVLIAPTYRADNKQKESELDFIALLLKISSNINNQVNILFKPHPYMNTSLNVLIKAKNIYILENESLNDLMLVSDAFLTDYSSAVFEYGLLNKPIAHFVPDLKEYEFNRGLYQKLDVTSDGEIIKDSNTLISWINQRRQGEYKDTSRMNSINFDNTKDMSKKIARHIIEGGLEENDDKIAN